MTESSATWDAVGVVAKKLATLTKVSGELAEDETVGLADWIVEEIAYAFASKEDDCGFNGDGTSTYGGITGLTVALLQPAHAGSKATAASGHDLAAEFDSGDIAALMGTLPETWWQSARFYCSAYMAANCFARLGSVAGTSIMTPSGLRPQLSYLGFPIELTPKLPGSGSQNGRIAILFGDLAASSILAERRGVTIFTSPHRFMELDQIAIVGTERVDVNNHSVGDATTAGPIVGLMGN